MGELYSWGNNENGKLGLGHLSPMYSPQKIQIYPQWLSDAIHSKLWVDTTIDLYDTQLLDKLLNSTLTKQEKYNVINNTGIFH